MRFYTTTNNTRNKTVGAGSHQGQTTHTRGWHSGVKVSSHKEGDEDVFEIFATHGSNEVAPDMFIGTVRKVGGVLVFKQGY